MATFLAPIGDETGGAGVLAVYRSTPITDAERSILEALASQLKVRFENQNLFEEIVEQKGHLSDVISATSDGIFVVSSDRLLFPGTPRWNGSRGSPGTRPWACRVTRSSVSTLEAVMRSRARR